LEPAVATTYYAPQVDRVLREDTTPHAHRLLFRVADEGLPTIGRPCLAEEDPDSSHARRPVFLSPLTRFVSPFSPRLPVSPTSCHRTGCLCLRRIHRRARLPVFPSGAVACVSIPFHLPVYVPGTRPRLRAPRLLRPSSWSPRIVPVEACGGGLNKSARAGLNKSCAARLGALTSSVQRVCSPLALTSPRCEGLSRALVIPDLRADANLGVSCRAARTHPRRPDDKSGFGPGYEPGSSASGGFRIQFPLKASLDGTVELPKRRQ